MLIGIQDSGHRRASPAFHAIRRLTGRNVRRCSLRCSLALIGYYGKRGRPRWVRLDQNKRRKGPSEVSSLIRLGKRMLSLIFLLIPSFNTINWISCCRSTSLVYNYNMLEICLTLISFSRRLVSPVGKAPVCCAGGSGSVPGRTFTQGLKIIEEKVLPLL